MLQNCINVHVRLCISLISNRIHDVSSKGLVFAVSDLILCQISYNFMANVNNNSNHDMLIAKRQRSFVLLETLALFPTHRMVPFPSIHIYLCLNVFSK